MPIRRAKSCHNCRVAKVRCSLSTPCLRCAKRHLECSYAPVRSRRPDRRATEGFRPIKPAIETAAASEDNSRGACASRPAVQDTGIEASTNTTVVASHDSAESILTVDGCVSMPCLAKYADHAPPSFAHSDTMDLLESSLCSNVDPQLLNYTEIFDLSGSFSPPVSLDLGNSNAISPLGITMMPHPTAIPSNNNAIGPQLSQRTRSLQQGSLTAKMILSRLTDYTRKMAGGRDMPPFICPPCSFGGDGECPPDSPHQCLPERLAICVNLTQMFYSRLPGSHGFVWQQICTHLRQMRAEVSSITMARVVGVPC